MKGIVKWFDDRKGYGFISSDDDHQDVFVHQTEIRMEGHRTLFEGQRVEFDIQSSEGGKSPLAKNVRKINE